jgi:hypothetical protein
MFLATLPLLFVGFSTFLFIQRLVQIGYIFILPCSYVKGIVACWGVQVEVAEFSGELLKRRGLIGLLISI